MKNPQPDIFISYAHEDNESPGEGRKGWVDLFHKSLLTFTNQYCAKEVSMWRDAKTPGNAVLKKEIFEKIVNASVLVTILTPKYLSSRWCKRELRWFIKSTKRKDWLNTTEAPIFKVAKTKTELEKHPQPIRGLLGYHFYSYDEITDRIKHFIQGEGVPYNQEYWDTLDGLAQDIVKTLTRLVPKVGAQLQKTPSDKTVYLAWPTPDLKSEYKRIKDELSARHYHVIPEGPPPTELIKIQDLVRDYLSRGRLSIHLVGKAYFNLYKGDQLRALIRLQNHLAAERLKQSNFSRIIWTPDEVKLTDTQQNELLSPDGHTWLQGTEFLQSSLEELKSVVLARLESNGHRKNTYSPSTRKTIYLIFDSRDQEHIVPVYGCLFGRGYEVVTPSFEKNDNSVKRHRTKLASCDAVLIYYGQGDQDWLESHLDDLEANREYAAISENQSAPRKSELVKAIYVAPPLEGHKRIFSTRRTLVLKSQDAFTCFQLQSFFELIERQPQDSAHG